jgi:hypothetical protein
MVTEVPPAVGPDVGEIEVATGPGGGGGGGATKVNWSADEVALAPPEGVVTVTS